MIAATNALAAGRSEWSWSWARDSFCSAVNYALLNWGIQYISSGLTAVLQAMTPVFGFVFAHVLLHDERMSAWKGLARRLGSQVSESSSGIRWPPAEAVRYLAALP